MAENRAKGLQPGVHVLHPPLLAVYRVMLLYAHNMGKTPPSALIRPTLVLAGGAILLWLVLWALIRNRLKAGIVASILIVALLTGWHILEFGIERVLPFLSAFPLEGYYLIYAALIGAGLMLLVRRYWNRPQAAALSLSASLVVAVAVLLIVTLWLTPIYGAGPAWTMALYVVAVGALVGYVLRWEGQFKAITQTANWFAIILVVISGALIVVHRPTGQPAAGLWPPGEAEALQPAPPPEEGWPDIYFIVVEGYARADVLRQDYHYNNLPFFDAMGEHGFTVADRSIANYSSSIASLASCLNMDYLQNLAATSELTSRDLLNLYHDNRVYRFLRERGYELVVFSPGSELLEPRAAVDRVMAPPGALSEFESVLLDTTAFARVLELVDYLRHGSVHHSSDLVQRRRVLYAFDGLEALARQANARPRFIQAHLLIPDPPFLFDREGDWPPAMEAIRTPEGQLQTTFEEFRHHYVNQLHFTNRMIERVTRSILEASPRPPVILVVSSRGPGLNAHADPTALTPDRLRTRMACLYMARFPDDTDSPLLPQEATCLVNLFRMSLNRIFGTRMPPRPSEAYVSTDEPTVKLSPVAIESLLE